jgi:hypothetical protein
MFRQILAPLLFLCRAGFVLTGVAPEKISYAQYHKPREFNALLQSFASAYPRFTNIIPIGNSQG